MIDMSSVTEALGAVSSAPPSIKPPQARHLKDATKHLDLSRKTLKILYDKAMDTKYTVRVDGYDCILSTRTGSQDMPQLKLEENGVKTQILCTHAVALNAGKKPTHWYDELSHLCGIRQCLIHTEWELPWNNVSRDGCHKYNHFPECPHIPPCLPEPPQHLVKTAIQKHRVALEDSVRADQKKTRKREENARQYERKKARTRESLRSSLHTCTSDLIQEESNHDVEDFV